MRQRTRIPRKRSTPRVIHPERSGGHLRVKLPRYAKAARRKELFERSGGRCEEYVYHEIWAGRVITAGKLARCTHSITWETMEWSHRRHGANKCDCLECGIASCQECHRKRHNAGGKPCPKKERAA